MINKWLSNSALKPFDILAGINSFETLSKRAKKKAAKIAAFFVFKFDYCC